MTGGAWETDPLRTIQDLRLHAAEPTAFPDEIIQVDVTVNGLRHIIDMVDNAVIFEESGLNPDIRNLVVRFAAAMGDKLCQAQKKYGTGSQCLGDQWMGECRQALLGHVAKGDPRDVANFCAFLWNHGESTCSEADGALNQLLSASATEKAAAFEALRGVALGDVGRPLTPRQAAILLVDIRPLAPSTAGAKY